MNAVLLVDDERDFADLLAERLQARGFRVQTAYDGEEALRLAAGHDLDVAVLDVNLPGIDGLTLLRELKKLRPQAEALMLTGQNDLATAVAGMKLGASDYLVKPVPIERLTEAIARAQERRVERLESLRMAETAKMAAIGQMAEGVAHEINNPVNVMVHLAGWMGDLLEDIPDAPADTLGELKDSLAKMQAQGVRCKQITAKLLCLCRKDAPAERGPVDLGGLLRELADARAGRMAAQGVAAELALPAEPPVLELPRADIAAALGNILDNALDAMPQGGRLSITVSRPAAEAGGVGVEIADTGHGISAANLPRVFEPFFSTKDVGQGTGLGLSVSYGTVKALGGDILMDSEPDKGTRVLVTLPG
jgi:signal transduction histidine kinase